MASSPVTNELPTVLQDVTAERAHQVALGWTPDHDDQHDPDDMIGLAVDRIAMARNAGAAWPSDPDPRLARHRLVQAIAILAAAVEAMDRRAAG